MSDFQLNFPESGKSLKPSIDALARRFLERREDLGDFTRNQTYARSDAQAIVEWTKLARGHNKVAREKEARRFAKWMMERGLGLVELRSTDLIEYYDFLQDPPPEWVGPSLPFRKKDGSLNERWRPLAGPMNKKSLNQTKVLLGSLFEYLAVIQWLPANLTRLIASERLSGSVSHLFKIASEECMEYLEGVFFDLWEATTKLEIERKSRAKMIIKTLYVTALRREEAVNVKMSDFSPIRGKWYLRVIGKGQKEDLVAVPESYMSDLASYRSFFGFSPLYPEKFSVEPLFFKLKGDFGPLTPEALYKEIKYICQAAASLCDNPAIASELRNLSTHWFRHTSATRMMRLNVPLRVVQAHMRHADPKTTSLYSHVSIEQSSESVEQVFGQSKEQ